MMARKPVDMAVVRDARKRLAEIAEEYPEAFAADRLPVTEARLRKALTVNPDPLVHMSFRVRASTRAALDARAKAAGSRTSDVVRQVIERALEVDPGTGEA